LLVDSLLECKILAHPGYFYEMRGTHIVMTFVEQRDDLLRALRALVEFADR
jgi:hypothetical protein